MSEMILEGEHFRVTLSNMAAVSHTANEHVKWKLGDQESTFLIFSILI
jgi:hypothetical protein